MITLQVPPRRGDLKSFWLVMSVTVGLLIGVLASLLISPRWFPLGVIVIPLLAFPGLLRPQIALIPYRAWNKLAREFAHYGSLWITYICYYVIFVVVGQAGSLLRLTRPIAGTSMWMPREFPIQTKHWDSKRITVEKSSYSRSWVAAFLSSAIKSGNWWACCLLPFLILLSILKSDSEGSAFPTGIYTLF